ncbi:MAG: 5'-3' exonuclease, partial [Anaeroplasmataceae bacterium]|nr:5'-3' exonuclease [Anaeroplasmataceae bacterium]
MDKLLLVDGSNLLFQMFYGMPSRILNRNGKPIHGVLGFIGALLKIIRAISPSHVLILFDGEHENPRKDLLTEYKSNRIDYSKVSEEENPFSQLEDIYNALRYLKIPFYETKDYEADDYIASYIKNNPNLNIVISSWDSDLFSLISSNVCIYRYKGENSYICDINYLKNKYDIAPSQYTLFKALCGDKSDNIPGIKGIGPKTASKLVNLYKSIDDIYDNIEVIKEKKLLENNKETLKT